MPDKPIPYSSGSFIESAREFASAALDAHVTGNFRRVALEAGTALEHLAKACLASRSPGLLTELRNENNFSSLLALLGVTGMKDPALVRTVSLRDALARVRKLITSTASTTDLQRLVDMRDGIVHAARNDEIEERLMVAFVQHADALLADMSVDRLDFWGHQLDVVDALLMDIDDKIAARVEVKLAAALARWNLRNKTEHPQLLDVTRKIANAKNDFDADTAPMLCPACECFGIATGIRESIYDYEGDVSTWPIRERFLFKAELFACSVCGLRLDSRAEIMALGLDADSEEEVSD
jgi:hypothetical protein